MKINRLLKIIMILMNRKNITVKYLAEHFEVSRKTIYRDLESLILAGIPVYYGDNSKGIISIMKDYSLKYADFLTKDNTSNAFDFTILKDSDETITSNEIEIRKEVWHKFMAQKLFDLDEIKEEIINSWRRCQREGHSLYHIDKKYIMLPKEAENHVIENLKEYELEGVKLFNSIIKNLGLHIVICDKNGYLKQIFNLNTEFQNLYPKLGYFRNCTEKAISTTAASLSLIEKKPFKVIGPEHYNQLLHQFSGASAPFYENSELAGVISLFFLHTSVTNHTLNMVYGLARLYESLIIKGSKVIPNCYDERADINVSVKKSFDHMAGISTEWQTIMSAAKIFSKIDVPLLLRGEEGIGKRSLAKCIHTASDRSEGPCVEFDCLSVPKELLKITLQGYPESNKLKARKGVVDGAIGGTLIFSNIEHLSEELQKKLYIYIKTKKVKRLSSNKMETYDVRVIVCTTLENLSIIYKPLREVLEIIQLKIPPLRERKEDIRSIVRNYINEVNGQKNIEPKVVETIIKELEKEEWPGNVRELLNKTEKLILLEME